MDVESQSPLSSTPRRLSTGWCVETGPRPFPPTNNGLVWGTGQWPSSLSVGHPRPARRGLFSECDLAVVGGNVARRSQPLSYCPSRWAGVLRSIVSCCGTTIKDKRGPVPFARQQESSTVLAGIENSSCRTLAHHSSICVCKLLLSVVLGANDTLY